MSRQRITTINALRLMAEQSARRRQAEAIEAFAARLEAGGAPDEVLAAVGDRLPGPLRGLFLSGIGDDRLTDAILDLAEDQAKDRELWRGVRVALAYPLLVLAILIPILLVLLTLVFPVVVEVHQGLGIELPEQTSVLIWLGEKGIYWAGILAVGLVLGLASVWFFVGRWPLDRVLYAVPLFGPLWISVGMAELARLLGTLLKHNIPLPDALRLTGNGLRDANLGRACCSMSVAVARGRTLDNALADSDSMPASLAALADWGQRSGSVPEALEIAGEMYQDRAELQASVLKTVLPPLLFVLEATIVALAVASLLLPLIGILTDWGSYFF